MSILSLTVVLATAWAAAEAPAIPVPKGPLPEELSSLQPLFSDETKLVEAVRAFDLHQQGLADWDFEMASGHSLAGEVELAKTKQASGVKRIALIRRAYEEVLARYPKNPIALTYYGELLYDREGDHAKGEALWLEALKQDPNLTGALNNLAIHYSHVGQYEKCFSALDKLLKLEPDNADYLYNAATLYLAHWPLVMKHYGWSKEKVYETAMSYSRKAAELLPTNYVMLQDYAINYFAGENMQLKVDWKEAAAAWANARKNARDTDELFYSWMNEARAWMRVPNKKKAAECLEEALKVMPGNETASRLLKEVKS